MGQEAHPPRPAVATATRRCECGNAIGDRPGQRFCSDACRFAAWDRAHPRQKAIPFQPPTELVQRLGPTPEQIRRAQKPQTVRVLAMLKRAGVMGCTTGDFIRAGIGRFGARVAELRAVGHQISMDKRTDHAALYVLEDNR